MSDKRLRWRPDPDERWPYEWIAAAVILTCLALSAALALVLAALAGCMIGGVP